MKDWKWFLERSKDFQNEPEHPLSNKEELFEYLENCNINSDSIILDVGCGRSDELRIFLSSKFNVNDYIGLDIVNYNDDFKIVRDVHDMGFFPINFDILIYNNVLEHSISPYLALLEANRVLKPEGIVIIGLPKGDGHDVSESHFIVLSDRQLKNLLNKTGFKLIDDKSVNTMHYYTARKMK
ncbi:MAG: methyltransferase domain-containing protein [Nanoarchaeota archaeon]